MACFKNHASPLDDTTDDTANLNAENQVLNDENRPSTGLFVQLVASNKSGVDASFAVPGKCNILKNLVSHQGKTEKWMKLLDLVQESNKISSISCIHEYRRSMLETILSNSLLAAARRNSCRKIYLNSPDYDKAVLVGFYTVLAENDAPSFWESLRQSYYSREDFVHNERHQLDMHLSRMEETHRALERLVLENCSPDRKTLFLQHVVREEHVTFGEVVQVALEEAKRRNKNLVYSTTSPIECEECIRLGMQACDATNYRDELPLALSARVDFGCTFLIRPALSDI